MISVVSTLCICYVLLAYIAIVLSFIRYRRFLWYTLISVYLKYGISRRLNGVRLIKVYPQFKQNIPGYEFIAVQPKNDGRYIHLYLDKYAKIYGILSGGCICVLHLKNGKIKTIVNLNDLEYLQKVSRFIRNVYLVLFVIFNGGVLIWVLTQYMM